MFLNFSRLISPKFIFNPALGSMSENFAKFFYILFGFCLIFSLAARLIASQQEKKKDVPNKKLWQKLTVCFATLGIVGLFLLFFRQQRVYFLSMPLFWYLWLIGALVWLASILRWSMTKMKKMQKEIEERREKEKYL